MAKNPTGDALSYYIRLPYAINIQADECDGELCYMASHPELFGCMAQGSTPEEAIRNLEGARHDYISALLEEGIAVPVPEIMTKSVAITKWVENSAHAR